MIIDTSNLCESQDAKAPTVLDHHIQDESSGEHVTSDVRHETLSSTPSLQQKISHSTNGSAQSSQLSGSPIHDSIQNPPTQSAELSTSLVSSQHRLNDNVNRSESSQSQAPKSDQIISENDQPGDLKLGAEITDVETLETHYFLAAKCEILQDNSRIDSNFSGDSTDHTTNKTYSTEDSFAHDSLMRSRDTSLNSTENDLFLVETDLISPDERNENFDQDDLCEDENYVSKFLLFTV